MKKKIDLNDEEIQRLASLKIFEKLEKGDWYQFSKEERLRYIVKITNQEVRKINEISRFDNKKAKKLLKKLLPHISSSVEIFFPVTSIEYPDKLWIEEETFINARLQVISAGKVSIGKRCFIGPNCQFFTPNHSLDLKYRREGWQYDLPITIGDDCWLGGSVTMLPGVSIANNVIVGAGSVVTKDFPSNCVIAGNPAKIIKYLT